MAKDINGKRNQKKHPVNRSQAGKNTRRRTKNNNSAAVFVAYKKAI